MRGDPVSPDRAVRRFTASRPSRGFREEPDGLWSATRFFGPEVRGDLWIEQRDGDFHASIAGLKRRGECRRQRYPRRAARRRGRIPRPSRTRIARISSATGSSFPGRTRRLPCSSGSARALGYGEMRPLDQRMTVHLMLQTGAETRRDARSSAKSRAGTSASSTGSRGSPGRAMTSSFGGGAGRMAWTR